MSTPSPAFETNTGPLGPPQHEDLLDGRYEMALQQAEHDARTALELDRIGNPDTIINQLRDTDFGIDAMKLLPADLMALDALGIEPTTIAEATNHKVSENSDIIFQPTVGDESLAVRHYGWGVHVTLSIAGHKPDDNQPRAADAMNELVSQRYAAAPGYQAVAEAQSLWKDQPQLPPIIRTRPFSADQDPLGNIAFLDDIGLIDNRRIVDMMRDGQSLSAIGAQAGDMIDSTVQAEITGDQTTYTWSVGKAAQRKLVHDKTANTYTYSITQQPEAAYVERADQAEHIEAVPFLETDCARQLCDMLDEAGLMFHPKFQIEMMQPGAGDRMGSAYTQLTREIAKWIDRPDRTTVRNLFRPKDAAYSGKELVSGDTADALANYNWSTPDLSILDIEASVRATWLAAAPNRRQSDETGEAAASIMQMVDDVLARQTSIEAGAEPVSDLPVTGHDIEISDGACSDMTWYYINEKIRPYVVENDVPMLEKIGGAKTFLTTEPIIFNGVRLPKGALMTHEDDGWAFLRLTPFSFDNPDDKLAFGSEVSKALRNQQVTAQTLGSLSLSRL